jgi:hypothetical protein
MPQGPAGLPGVPVRVVAALEAITDPFAATPLFAAETDAAGRVDGLTDGPVTTPIAIVAVTGGDAGFYPMATGIAADIGMGMFEVGIATHDLWALHADTLTAFNAALEADPTIPSELLPLGEAGGVVGVVRDAGGSPIAGAVVQPVSGASGAVVRYVTDGGSVDAVATQGSGAFVVLGPTPTGEDFQATLDGAPIAGGTAASANGLVFALALTAG